jgi:D-alanyl-D-alanine carboxypeptidase/D-alanyl-D-alanine-endopeptidase (penicillin-binding protein 4)
VVDAGGFTGAVHGPWDADIPGGGFVGPVTALMTDGGRVDPRQGAPAMRWDQPDLAAGEAFAALLGAGEVVRGTAPPPPAATGPASGAAAPGTELGRVYSPPVIRLVEIMLVDSDNVVAESLARQVALARGEPASYQGAAAAMTAVLAELGLPVSDIVLSDGSGLSRGNRVTPALLAGLLAAAVSRPELAGLFAGLPVAGWSGTLAERYRTPQPETTPGAGVVRAKTGSLRGISALAGVVVTADGRLLTFALLANDASATAPDQLDRIAAKLATCGCA